MRFLILYMGKVFVEAFYGVQTFSFLVTLVSVFLFTKLCLKHFSS